jgi:serine/threonine protein kinase
MTMTRERNADADREQRLNEVLLAYVEGAQAGCTPDRHQVLAAHPDLRTELEEFFASHDEVARLAGSARRTGKQEAVGALAELSSVPGRIRPGNSGEPENRAAGAELGLLGDFRLLREVGRGGMGVVYEAEQISLRRQVALKVLPFAAAIDPRQLQRFRNESLAAAHLHHESIVPVYAVGSERGVHYYAMQFIEGQSLSALIEGLRRLGGTPRTPPPATGSHPMPAAETTGPYKPAAADTQPEEANLVAAASISRERSAGSRRYFTWLAGLGRQAALALEHAHQLGIVHRDIKPANLLLDPRGQVWVTDFGLAQMSGDAGLTMTGELLGTLRYASPEQALGKKGLVDHRSDIYSLGATLYELLTLRPVFDGRDRHELLRQIADEEPRSPRILDRAVPVELETIIMKALAKEPSDRYATAQELADDLQRFLEDRPIRARRPSMVEKATKWARRHKSIVASGFVALVLSVAGLSAATLLTARAYDRERIKANEADASFRQAQQAVKLFEQISEEELAGQPPLQGLRRRLLEAALTYYQSFIEQGRDDPSIRKELEDSRARVRTILAELTTLMGAGEYHLLSEKAVQDDLDLSHEQRQSLAGLDKQFDNRWRDAFHGFPSANAAARQQKLLTVARDQEKAVANVLTDQQLRRFHEIILQQRGLFAFMETDVAETLKLTTDQRKKVREVLDETGAAALAAGPGAGCGPGHAPAQSPDVWKRGQERMLALLTPAQQQAWVVLVGKPFQGQRPAGPPRLFVPSPGLGDGRRFHHDEHRDRPGPRPDGMRRDRPGMPPGDPGKPPSPPDSPPGPPPN